MHFSAKRGLAIACRLSGCPSVTLVDCDHIGWNSSEIISLLVSLGCSLSAECRPIDQGSTPREHPKFSPKVTTLHWLRVPERISFRLAVLVYRCLHDSAPGTWRQIFNASQTSAHVGGCARRLRQRSSPHAPCVLPLATEPSRRLLHLFGTVCRRQFRQFSFPQKTED